MLYVFVEISCYFMDVAILCGQRGGNVYYIEKGELIDRGFRKKGRLEDV